MVDDQQLDALRLTGERIRVVRDVNPENDVLGWLVAWNDQEIIVRKANKKVVKLKRSYAIQSVHEARSFEI
jgi:RNase P/RNase MRP subunit p29